MAAPAAAEKLVGLVLLLQAVLGSQPRLQLQQAPQAAVPRWLLGLLAGVTLQLPAPLPAPLRRTGAAAAACASAGMRQRRQLSTACMACHLPLLHILLLQQRLLGTLPP